MDKLLNSPLKHQIINQADVAEVSRNTNRRLARCQHFYDGLERIGIETFYTGQ